MVARRLRLAVRPSYFVRDVAAQDYTELFLITAVVTVLIIRFFLWLTDYPQVGNDTLHIAHLLWGGLGMLVAIVMLLTFIGRQWKWMAALIGGAGFGAFIDELGKFITSDNDYFFQPTIALIYIIFIALYFGTRELQRRRQLSPAEYLVNAMTLLNKVALGTLERNDQRIALTYLDHCDPDDPVVLHVRQILLSVDLTEGIRIGPYYRIKMLISKRYRHFVERRWIQRAIAAWMIFDAVGSLIWVLGIVYDPGEKVAEASDFVQWCLVLSTLASNAFVLIGLYALFRRTRLDAFRWYRLALLTDIFITQIFMFAENQLSAIFSLFLNLLILAAIQISMGLEAQRQVDDLEGRASLTEVTQLVDS